jgi:hypothetical protein
MAPQPSTIPVGERCALCECRLETPYWIARGLCGSCSERPEAKRLPRDANGKALPPMRPHAVAARPPAGQTPAPIRSRPPQPRAFTPADTSLIRAMRAYTAAGEILRILNERLQADVGAAVPPYTLEQLQVELDAIADSDDAKEWAGLRQVLADARRAGTLAAVTPQIVEDFAVVFALTPAQLLHVRDVIASAREDR